MSKKTLSATSPTLFPPNAFSIGAFIGGPMVAVYFMYQNSLALKLRAFRRALIPAGLVLYALELAVVSVIPIPQDSWTGFTTVLVNVISS